MSSDEEDARGSGGEEEEEEDDGGGVGGGSGSPRKGKSSFVEEEAAESEDGEGSDEEEDDKDEFEKDGFVVDEDEDEEGSGESDDDEATDGRKKRRKRETLELDEEDEDLIAENMGLDRPKEKKRKRIMKKAEDKQGEDSEQKGNAEEAVRHQLFGDDEGLVDEGLADEVKQPQDDEDDDEDDFDEEEDEFADFIVDEEDKYDEDGNLIPRQKKKKKKKKASSMVSSYALREAQEIFGNVDELLDLYQERKAANKAAAEEDPDLDEDLDDDDDDMGGWEAKEQKRKAAQRRKASSKIDPSLMAKHFFTELDDQIRETDMPERMQSTVLGVGVPPVPSDEEIAAEGEWIYGRVFAKNAPDSLAKQLVEDGVMEDHEDQKPDDDDGAGDDLYRVLRPRREGDEVDAWHESEAAQEDLKLNIRNVVGLLNGVDPGDPSSETRYFYEVPFIGQWRKEWCGQLLCLRSSDKPGRDSNRMVGGEHRRVRRWDVLYAVADWDAKWKALQLRREGLRKVLEAAQEVVEGAELEVVESCLDALPEAATLEAVDDVDRKFRLRCKVPQATAAMGALSIDDEDGEGAGGGKAGRKGGAGGYRGVVKTTLYDICRKAGMAEVARKIGLSAAELGENLEQGYMRNEPEDDPSMPEAVASHHTEYRFGMDTVEKVLEHAQHMLGCEIACEPQVREAIREEFRRKAGVTTHPTAAGLDVLDPFHMAGPVRSLKDKPLRDFREEDAFLRIVMAEREGLLTLKVELSPNAREELLKHLEESFLSEGVSDSARAWNEQRRAVLRLALDEQLLPQLERDMRAELLGEAREEVLREVSKEAWALASKAPWRPRIPGGGADDDQVAEEARVMACCWGDGKPATTFVVLDPQGEMIDVLHCGWLSGRIRPGRGVDARKDRDMERLQDFMQEHRPHVCVLGAANLECRALRQDLQEVVNHIVQYNPRMLPDTGTIDLVMHSEMVPRVWEDCPQAQEQFPEQQCIVRRAIALGRCLQDPVALLAGMCGAGREVLALPMHPLQGEVDDAGRVAAVERALVTVVNQCGVDFNLADAHEWMAPAVNYVAGLGPRKGTQMLRALRRLGGIRSRMEIMEELGMGPCVFRNAAGVLRVRTRSNDEVDVLDDTRIHPESYQYAQQMAQDALGEEEQGGEGDTARLIEAAMLDPQKVEDLDLHAYEKFVKDQMGRRVLPTLVDIVFEFRYPYAEIRPAWEPPDERAEFELLSGARMSDLREGRLLTGTVVSVQRDQVVVEIEGGLKGAIQREELSSSAAQAQEVRLDSVVAKGQSINVAILSLDTAGEYPLALSSRGSRLADRKAWERKYCGTDKYYEVLPEEEEKDIRREERARERKVAKAKTAVKAKAYRERRIDHPSFRNVTMAEAVEELRSGEVGDFILRPSQSHGTTHLTVTLKFMDGQGEDEPDLVTHVDIKEGEKPSGPTSHLRLGLPLTIAHHGGTEERYEDLDEVAARYIEPRVELMREVQAHRKFRRERKGELDEVLRREKQARPATFPYYLAADYDHPGLFYIAYVVSTNPHHERIAVNPAGLRFREKHFSSPDKLINWFKHHYKERPVARPRQPPPPQRPPPQQQPQQQQQHAPRSPYHHPAGGYGGAPPQMASGYGAPQQPPPPPGPWPGVMAQAQQQQMPPPRGPGGPPPPPPGPGGWGPGGGGSSWAGGGGWGPGPHGPHGPGGGAHSGGFQHHAR